MRIRLNVWRVTTLMLVIVVAGAIFALTVQSPQGTMDLSTGFSAAVERMLGSGGVPNQFLVRKFGHTIEFFGLGCAVSLCTIAWTDDGMRWQDRLAVAAAICVGNSLFDQTHKLLVAGREFDFLDLPFDIAGYTLAIMLVFGVWLLVKRGLMGRR